MFNNKKAYLLSHTTLNKFSPNQKCVRCDLSWNHHLIIGERFVPMCVCPYEPGSYVVWTFVLLVGSTMANWSQMRCQTKTVSRGPQEIMRKMHGNPSQMKIPSGTRPGNRGQSVIAWWFGMPQSLARQNKTKSTWQKHLRTHYIQGERLVWCTAQWVSMKASLHGPNPGGRDKHWGKVRSPLVGNEP